MQHGITANDTDGIEIPQFDGTQPCAHVEDPDIFFPEPEEPGFYQKQKEAKDICRTCSFVIPCLEYALKIYPLGIWGATTHSERKRLRALRRK